MSSTNDSWAVGNETSTTDGEETPLLIGFDFGTSYTAVMSNRGHQQVFRSVVGYPKDMIGVKLLGEPYVVGDAAFEKRSFVDLRSPLKDGVLREYVERDMEVARDFVDHTINSIAKDGDEVAVIVGVPARASNTNKDLMVQVFEDFADTVQVISEPFLVAYGRGSLVNSLVIDIGAGTVDICALKGAMPGQKSQITINKAGNFVDEQIEELILKSHPEVQMNIHMAQAIKEKHGFVGAVDAPVMADLRVDGKPAQFDITKEISTACEMIVPGIIEGVEKLIQTCSPEDQGTMLNNIFLAGGGSRIQGLDKMIAERLVSFGDVQVSRVSDPTYAVAAGALKLAQELPPQYWDQLGSVTDN
ncbi:Magnetosome protein MamK (MreB-actin-like) [Candidatus Terasakiella magnetica]|uniref:Magnetosome protein MamK (MreB-actin-like) n=1 Tax=Candidatus Terasakiella magnetica TaxID=1867952 RepID=A0A1C3RFN3_9PROT|nr:MamK family actin-like protein [Candidatus Terasakiella magnetica]SCA56090.1 Magnetosome protein MamK (MreB-actin-like) [Candidatus Terasakiella magnetica]